MPAKIHRQSLSRRKKNSTDSWVYCDQVAELGALAVLNVAGRYARTDVTLRARIASMEPVAEQISLPRVVRRIQKLAA